MSLALAAAETKNAVLATMVTALLRHPMILARSMLSIAQLCDGRVAIGLGFGGRSGNCRGTSRDVSGPGIRRGPGFAGLGFGGLGRRSRRRLRF